MIFALSSPFLFHALWLSRHTDSFAGTSECLKHRLLIWLMRKSNFVELYKQKMKEEQKPALLELRMQFAFAYWEITGKHLLLYSSVTDQLCSAQLKQRNVKSSLHQLCWAALETASFRNRGG